MTRLLTHVFVLQADAVVAVVSLVDDVIGKSDHLPDVLLKDCAVPQMKQTK